MNMLHILANDGFICVNKRIIRQLGLEEAVIIGELASIYVYNETRGTLEDGWFYATIERIEENTGLSEYKQQQVISKLCNLGILQQKFMGMPRRKYFIFDTEKLIQFIEGNIPEIQAPENSEAVRPVPENSEASSRKFGGKLPKIRRQAPENSEAIYNNNYNNTYKNTDNNPSKGISNKNINILENTKKSTPTPPRVSTPQVQAGLRLPNKVKAKLLDFDTDTRKSLENYCLFLADTYSLPERTLLNRIDEICRQARNVGAAIQAICKYNINGGYKTLYVPGNLSRVVSDAVVISEEVSEDDFVRDADGNIEEIW